MRSHKKEIDEKKGSEKNRDLTKRGIVEKMGLKKKMQNIYLSMLVFLLSVELFDDARKCPKYRVKILNLLLYMHK